MKYMVHPYVFLRRKRQQCSRICVRTCAYTSPIVQVALVEKWKRCFSSISSTETS